MPGNILQTGGGGTPDNNSVTSAKIVDGAVALADMADLATNTVIGRSTAGTGVPETITCTAAARSIMDDASVAAIATTLALGTGDSPQFTGIELGNASDTTLTRASAGVMAVEGKNVYMVGGADVAIADGGTGASTFSAAQTGLGFIVVRKTADESVTSSTTLQNDDHLSFSIAASEEWVADFQLSVSVGLTTSGIKIAIATPSGCTQEIFGSIVGPSGVGHHARTTTSGAVFVDQIPTGAGGFGVAHLRIWALNGATPGTVQLQWAQDSSSASPVTIVKGSYLAAQRIA